MQSLSSLTNARTTYIYPEPGSLSLSGKPPRLSPICPFWQALQNHVPVNVHIINTHMHGVRSELRESCCLGPALLVGTPKPYVLHGLGCLVTFGRHIFDHGRLPSTVPLRSTLPMLPMCLRSTTISYSPIGRGPCIQSL